MSQKNKKNKAPQIKIHPNQYLFINPIIITKDDFIVDGQHRAEVCKLKNLPIRTICLDFYSSEITKPECIKQIRGIQKSQRETLERYFKTYDIGYTKQMIWVSSEDRFEKFYGLKDKFIAKGNYWEILAKNYTMCNNTYRFKKELKEVFTDNVPGREKLITDKAKEILENLPEQVIIYRGMSVTENETGDYGISWTLDKKVAEKFAFNYIHNYDTIGQEHIVKELVVDKSKIVAYFDGRNEQEIIYIHNVNLPTNV